MKPGRFTAEAGRFATKDAEDAGRFREFNILSRLNGGGMLLMHPLIQMAAGGIR